MAAFKFPCDLLTISTKRSMAAASSKRLVKPPNETDASHFWVAAREHRPLPQYIRAVSVYVYSGFSERGDASGTGVACTTAMRGGSIRWKEIPHQRRIEQDAR